MGQSGASVAFPAHGPSETCFPWSERLERDPLARNGAHISLLPEGEREVICQIFASKCFSVELLGRVVDMIIFGSLGQIDGDQGVRPRRSEIKGAGGHQHLCRVHRVRARAARVILDCGRASAAALMLGLFPVSGDFDVQ